MRVDASTQQILLQPRRQKYNTVKPMAHIICIKNILRVKIVEMLSDTLKMHI
jgi:hypothetical protein